MTEPYSSAQRVTIMRLWGRIDPGRGDERPSRQARIEEISSTIGRRIQSANNLTKDEASKVIEAWKKSLGETFQSAPYGRKPHKADPNAKTSSTFALKIAALAEFFWYPLDWNDHLRRRLGQKFKLSRLAALTYQQARSLKEELLERAAVRDLRADGHTGPLSRAAIGAKKAALRTRFFPSQGQRRSAA